MKRGKLPRWLMALFVAGAAGSAAGAAETELPMRKAGLWDIKMHITGGGVPTMSMKHCTDAATDKDLRTLYSPMSKETCAISEVARSSAGYSANRTCKRGDETTVMRVEISGDFQTSYEARLVSRAPDASPADPPASDMTLTAKYLGPCKADQQPGDIMLMGGMKVNVRDVIKMREKPADGVETKP